MFKREKEFDLQMFDAVLRTGISAKAPKREARDGLIVESRRERFLILIWSLPASWFEELCQGRFAAVVVTSDNSTGFLSPRVIVSGGFVF